MRRTCSARVSASAKSALTINVHYNYTDELDGNLKIPANLRQGLKDLSMRRSVKHSIDACNTKYENRRRNMTDYDIRSLARRESNKEIERRKEVDALYERFNMKRPRDPKSFEFIPPYERKKPNISTKSQEQQQEAPVRDYFAEFCSHVHLKTVEPSKIQVQLPPERPKAAQKRRPFKKKSKGIPHNEENVKRVIGPASSTHQLFIDLTKLGKDRVIDLDSSDFMDYVITTVKS